MTKHCSGNSQIKLTQYQSKEFPYITFLYITIAKVYAYSKLRAHIIHSQREIEEIFDPKKLTFSINSEHKRT